jgi:methylglutaconyl-CoA hydratase
MVTSTMWMHTFISMSPARRIHPNSVARMCQRWQTTQILLKNISLKHDAIISTITLDRPKANAMGSQMLDELSRVMDILEHDSTRCVILTSSSPKVFSAGADLKERAAMSLAEAEEFVHRLRTTMVRFSKLPMPTICAVEGVAVGGGLELALAADIRIAGRNAVFGLPETSLAIIPGAGGTQRLPRLIGEARAKELIFTGRRIDAETAHEYGLVQHVVNAGHADERAIE